MARRMTSRQMKKEVSVRKTTDEGTVAKLKSKVDEAVAINEQWSQNIQKWHKMRMRIKKSKTFPFVGCSNLRMPTIETKLRKQKASLVNIVFGIRPVVQVTPTPSGNWESARKIEKFLDHIIMDRIKLTPKATIAIDQALEKGFYLMKPYWNTKIMKRVEKLSLDDISVEEATWLFAPERTPDEMVQAVIQKFNIDMNPLVQEENVASARKVVEALEVGKTKIDVVFQDVLCDYPDVALCDPEKTYVSPDAGWEPESSEYIIHEFMLPIEEVRQNAEIKGWSQKAINQLKEVLSSEDQKTVHDSTTLEEIKDIREGIYRYKKTNQIRVWEYYGNWDIDGDGMKEKAVITCAPDFNLVFRKIVLPFASGKKPFVKVINELTDDRWYSHRGMPEIIEDIVKEIDMQHNQKLDQQTMRNAPMYIFRSGMINKNTIQFIFGQGIPASGLQPLDDVIRPLNNANNNVEFSYEREQMMLETKIEELLGQPDFTLQSMINKRQPRTLGEVNYQMQSMQTVFTMDVELVRHAFTELFNWIWELWSQYGSDEYEFAYFGENGYEPIKMTREELQGKYKIVIRGNDQNTNPQLRLQKAQMILQAQQQPAALQSGVVTPQNIANAYKRLFQELDIPNWEELVSMPQPQPQPLPIQAKMDDLTDAEKAQVLARMGVQPDVQGRAMKSRATVEDKEIEQRTQEIDNLVKSS